MSHSCTKDDADARLKAVKPSSLIIDGLRSLEYSTRMDGWMDACLRRLTRKFVPGDETYGLILQYRGLVAYVACIFTSHTSANDYLIASCNLDDIRLDESVFGFRECIGDARVYTCTRAGFKRLVNLLNYRRYINNFIYLSIYTISYRVHVYKITR